MDKQTAVNQLDPGTHRRFLDLELRLMKDSEHCYFTAENLGRHPSHNELAFRWMVLGKAELFRNWFDRLTIDQREIMLQVDSCFELYLLVNCGYLPDPFGWFAKYPTDYLNWLHERG